MLGAVALPRPLSAVLAWLIVAGLPAEGGGSSLSLLHQGKALASKPPGAGPGPLASRAAAAGLRAENAASATKMNLEMAGGGGGGGSNAEAQVKQALQQTTALRDEARALLPAVEQQAYAVARAAAEAKVSQLNMEANEYFELLKANFKLKTIPAEDPKMTAVAQASQPYYEAEATLKAMVQNYNDQAKVALANAHTLEGSAQALAKQAQVEQAEGKAYWAQQHMLEAHQTIARASNTRGLALRIRRMADAVNNAIPQYQQASEMATAHATALAYG